MNFPQNMTKVMCAGKACFIDNNKNKKNKTKENNTMVEKLYGAPLSFSELLRDDSEGATTG